jgi:predicted transglutaminase-like cysteine proteinase
MRRALLAAAVALSIFPAPVFAASVIKMGANKVVPMEYKIFCYHYKEDCIAKEAGAHWLTLNETQKIKQLDEVNALVNAGIVERFDGPGIAHPWSLWPSSGWCGDYVVTKRHILLWKFGWPSDRLRIAEVVQPGGDTQRPRMHHAVLVVRMTQGDVVLDSRHYDQEPEKRDRVTPWEQLPYRWVRIESPDDPAQLWRLVVKR